MSYACNTCLPILGFVEGAYLFFRIGWDGSPCTDPPKQQGAEAFSTQSSQTEVS